MTNASSPAMLSASRALMIVAEKLGDYAGAKALFSECLRDGTIRIVPRWISVQRIPKGAPTRIPTISPDKKGGNYALMCRRFIPGKARRFSNWVNLPTWESDAAQWDWSRGIFFATSNPAYVKEAKRVGPPELDAKKTRVVFGGVRFRKSEIDSMLAASRRSLVQSPVGPKQSRPAKNIACAEGVDDARKKHCSAKVWLPAVHKVRESIRNGPLKDLYKDLKAYGVAAQLENRIGTAIDELSIEPVSPSTLKRARIELVEGVIADREKAWCN